MQALPDGALGFGAIYDDHVMSTAESQLALAYSYMHMRACASIWSCGGDIVIPDRVVPGLDGISWGKTCKRAPV